MCQALMKYETIDSGQIDQLMNREPVSPPASWEESNDRNNDTQGPTPEQTTLDEDTEMDLDDLDMDSSTKPDNSH